MTAPIDASATVAYLAQHFVDAERLGARLGVSGAQVETLVEDGLLPRPSYVATDGRLISVAFGPLDGRGVADGAYFHAGMTFWLGKALTVRELNDPVTALKHGFIADAERARGALEQEGWVPADCMGDDGHTDPASVSQWLTGLWESHQAGIFGVCVRQPDVVPQIVLKEVMQAVLSAMTDNGGRTEFSPHDAAVLRALTNRYAEACSDFAPVEYPRSSRKRYLEDLRLPVPR